MRQNSVRPLRSALLCLMLAVAAGCGGGAPQGPLLVHSFENATGNDQLDGWSFWLTDMLIRDLWQADVPATLSPLRGASLVAAAGAQGRDGSLTVAREAGVASVFFGRLAVDSSGFLLSGELVDPATGETLISVQTRASSTGDLAVGIDALRDQIWDYFDARPAAARPVQELTTASLPAYGEFMLGETEYHEGRFLAAEEAYSRAGQADVEFALAHYRRTTAAMQYVVVPTAQLESSISLAWSRRQRASARDRLAIEALRALIFGEVGMADTLYTEIRGRWPGDKEMDYFHGVALGQARQSREAMAAFAAAVEADPDFSIAWEALANTAFVLGERQVARQAVQSALGKRPGDPRLQEAAATFEMFAGNLEQAEEILEQALHFRQEPSLLLARGQLDLLRGEVDRASQTFTSIKSPFPLAVAEIYKGRIHAALARLQAMTDLQIAGGHRIAAGVGLWYSGLLAQVNGNADLAEQQFTRCINFAGEFSDCLGAMGALFVERGNLKRARDVLGVLRNNRREEAGWDRHELRLEGLIVAADGDFGRGVNLLRQALQMAQTRFLAGGYISDHPVYALALGQTLLQQGDADAAGKVFSAIAAMAGDRVHWPWIWLEAEVQLTELAARDRRPEAVQAHAATVRAYWGEAGGQGQPVVDELLARLERVAPAAQASTTP